MTDTWPVHPATGRPSIFAGLWAWLCTSFVTSVPEAGKSSSHRLGPWDQPRCNVYVTGCEVSCIEERPYARTASDTAARYAIHRYGR